MLERRAFPRQQVDRSGKIILADEPCYIDCDIRNISENGALVGMRVSLPLPHNVFLWDAKTGTFYDCSVQWRKLNLVGLRFTDICGRAVQRALSEKCALPDAAPAPDARLHPTTTRSAA